MEATMDSEELGRKVLEYRRRRGLSQEKLADEANISRNYVSLIERGEARNISSNVLDQIAIALGIAPSVLIEPSGSQPMLIEPTLRQFAIEDGVSFEIVDKLSRIPARGKKPDTVDEWRELYRLISDFL
jgi:transcriptional regulator with XRE-family HTH domain